MFWLVFLFVSSQTKIMCPNTFDLKKVPPSLQFQPPYQTLFRNHLQLQHAAGRITRFFIFHSLQMMSSEHPACGWLHKLLVLLVKLHFAFAEPLQPLNGTGCTAKGPASYILVFTGHWSPQAFPKQYPLFRPPAQWSKLIGEKDMASL